VQAVADGVKVGYDIYRIKTEVSEKGVTVKAGHDYQKRDRLTCAKRWEIQEAEETYQKTQLDRSVVVPDQIRTVIRTFREKLFTEIFTDRPARAKAMGLDEPWVPKTLIFAKDDSHARTSSTSSARRSARETTSAKKSPTGPAGNLRTSSRPSALPPNSASPSPWT
jgi:type I restriction enzyme, R subunit